MATEFGDKNSAITAKTSAFGNYIDSDRVLVDVPNLSLVEVDLPEYNRNGLGRALLKVVRYQFTDIEKFGAEGLVIGADSSRGHIVYADMNPQVVGMTHTEVQDRAPAEIIKALYQRKLPIELVSLGALRYAQFKTVDALVDFIDRYHARASWMEIHPVEVRFSNIEGTPFDWASVLPSAK